MTFLQRLARLLYHFLVGLHPITPPAPPIPRFTVIVTDVITKTGRFTIMHIVFAPFATFPDGVSGRVTVTVGTDAPIALAVKSGDTPSAAVVPGPVKIEFVDVDANGNAVSPSSVDTFTILADAPKLPAFSVTVDPAA